MISNFKSSINTILISPRRWGKSSLVYKAAGQVQKQSDDIVVCMIDLFNIRTEEEFYKLLATKVLQVSATKLDTILENAGHFLGRFIPNLSFSPDPGADLKLSLNWDEVKKEPDDILDLAEKVAIKIKKSIVICVDEFQNIAAFDDPLSFQKKLRAHWQLHHNVSYCLYGSKRHMLMEVFSSPSMPFYKFGDIIFMEKIKEKEWVEFITKRFNDTGKSINTENAGEIARYCENHSYYVQQLAQQAWLRTDKQCGSEIIKDAFEVLILQLSMLFQQLTDELSVKQVNFLNALVNNEDQVSSQKVLKKYNLGTSANVIKIKKVLNDKEIIDSVGRKIEFLDPLYRNWLKKYYFN
ncbi:ATP-binding protein [Saccharicrinis sp. FJH54]|uniref:AAA family ATPase n=1 Tax=Saccharicrinis sp. FJH54 TaxID=3344665 RepID=UPI0035D4E9FF